MPTYFCVDIETSGPVPGLYSLLSAGVVVCRTVARPGGVRCEPTGDEMYVEIVPATVGADPEAMAVNGLDLARLAREGVPLYRAITLLRDFTLAHRNGPDDRPVFVGHNAPFDWSFVNHAFVHCGIPNPFGWKALDTKALAMGKLGIEWEDTTKETISRLLPEVGPEDLSQKHRADYDARYQARILCALLNKK